MRDLLLPTLTPILNGPGRHYHNRGHIDALFRAYDQFRQGDPLGLNLEEMVAVELAILFHDIIYDARKSDHENVDQSRFMLIDMLSRVVSPRIMKMADEAIGMTKRYMELEHPENFEFPLVTKLMHDLDLGILAADGPIYNLYERNIREEYSFVPDVDFLPARIRILTRFRERAIKETLFWLPRGRWQHHLVEANLNCTITALERELEKLSKE